MKSTTSFKQSKNMAASCNICCEFYNKSTRSVVKCCFGDCNFEACKNCVRKYLLSSTNDPHCMNCKKSWNQDFMTMNLNRSFVSQEYKETRMDLLLETEMSKMPQTMEAAQREKQIQDEKKNIMDIDDEINELQMKIKKLSSKRRHYRIKIQELQYNSVETKERKKFIMPCPGNDCRGFLSSQYKCEMCNMHTCPKCLVIIGPNKNVEHVCNEDMVKSAELIKQETKPCPSCGTRISKISGCNQMWCTNCHIAFSWNTGTIDNGPVHNPHFYEYQKTTNANGVAPRNPGDVVCGGLCSIYTLRRATESKLNKTPYGKENRVYIQKIITDIESLHRIGLHISEVSLPHFRNQARDIDHNESLRVDYILKRKTKEELRNTVYQRDHSRQKNKEVLYIFELLNVSLIEMFAQIIQSQNNEKEFADEIEGFLKQFENLAKYCNENFENISVSYNRVAPHLKYAVAPYDNYSYYRRNSSNQEVKYEWMLVDKKYESYSQKKKKHNEKQAAAAAAASED